MRYTVSIDGADVIVADSISEVRDDDAGHVYVSGSHGSRNVAIHALSTPLRAAVFNDAGLGKDNAGISSFEVLADGGLPAAAAASSSARIGDGRDMLDNGVVSAVNRVAAERGATVGMTVRGFVELMLGV